jgi:lysyl-tRNA synthetase class 1
MTYLGRDLIIELAWVKPKKAFGAIYTVLIGKKSGPKAGPFIAGLPPEITHDRLGFVVAPDTETGSGAG